MITPRPYQEDSIEHGIFDYFKHQSGNPLIVAPTGSGKSLINAFFMKRADYRFPKTRILLATHAKELIEQDYNALMKVWPDAPAGIYSAGLKRRDDEQFLFAGIQSIYRRAFDFDPFDIMVIDEAHLLPKKGEGMYRQFIRDLKVNNPFLKIVGLTATPFRMESGLLTDGPNNIFTDISYEITIQELLAGGYIAPLVSKGSKVKVKGLDDLKLRGGDYVAEELANLYSRQNITEQALEDVIENSEGRKSWLVFCCNVAHAEEARAILRMRGIDAECIHGATPAQEREDIIREFREGKIQAITNCMVLTTGFDAPAVDLIAFLRPTHSAGLFMQMAGRGMRIAPGKNDCLCRDFANLIATHGPVDSIRVRKQKFQRGEGGEKTVNGIPHRECPNCLSFVPISSTECADCGYIFPLPEVKHETVASDLPILTTTKTVDVDHVEYRKHEKNGSFSLRVEYYDSHYDCEIERLASLVLEHWVCFEHGGLARIKAIKWWRARFNDEAVPSKVDHVLVCAPAMPEPKQIECDFSGKFARLVREIW